MPTIFESITAINQMLVHFVQMRVKEQQQQEYGTWARYIVRMFFCFAYANKAGGLIPSEKQVLFILNEFV